MQVAVLSCANLPSFVTWEIPDVEALFADDRRLISEFAARGVGAESVVWKDAVDWDLYDAAVIRSTWDYIDQREDFLSVLDAIEGSSCRLFNPLDAVRWNSEKSYLFDLSEWGVPIVPTEVLGARAAAGVGDDLLGRGWDRAVLKPRVGAAGFDVRLVPAGDVADTLAELTAGRPQREFLLQPYVESIADEGEWSFAFIDGRFSYALIKRPAAGDYRTHGIYGGSVRRVEPAAGDLAQAEEMLSRLPFDLLYARLDLVRIDGRLAVMEVELVEPILYFDHAPEAAGMLAAATLSRISR